MKAHNIVISIAVSLLLAGVVAGVVVLGKSAREQKRIEWCCNNLRLIHHSKAVNALKRNMRGGESISMSAVALYIHNGFPVCPADGEYSINIIQKDPTCSIHGPLLALDIQSSDSILERFLDVILGF